jgi:DNA-binding response OmpR family regulator
MKQDIEDIMNGKILAVDDEPDQLAMLDELLTEEGFTIDTAVNGLDAFDKIGRCRPDLIVTDISMPKMNGFTFCEKLRKNPATAAIPVLMLTGLRSQLDRLNGFAHGTNAYLIKPYKPEELIGVVNKVLRGAMGASPLVP